MIMFQSTRLDAEKTHDTPRDRSMSTQKPKSKPKGLPRGRNGGRKRIDGDLRVPVTLSLPADVAESIPSRSDARAQAVAALVEFVRGR